MTTKTRNFAVVKIEVDAENDRITKMTMIKLTQTKMRMTDMGRIGIKILLVLLSRTGAVVFVLVFIVNSYGDVITLIVNIRPQINMPAIQTMSPLLKVLFMETIL